MQGLRVLLFFYCLVYSNLVRCYLWLPILFGTGVNCECTGIHSDNLGTQNDNCGIIFNDKNTCVLIQHLSLQLSIVAEGRF